MMKASIKSILIVTLTLGLHLTTAAAAKQVWLGFSYKSQTISTSGFKESPGITNPTNKMVKALQVEGKFPSSGAASSKLVKGDMVIGFQMKSPIYFSDSFKPLMQRLKNARPGEQVDLLVVRNQRIQKIQVRLTPRPDDLRAFTGSNLGSKAKSMGKNFYANPSSRNPNAKVTVLDFWATWCGPCRQTLPVLDELYKKHKARGLEVIGVSSEALPTLQKFQKMQKSHYPLFQDIGGMQSRHYGIRAVPTILILDSQGYIVEQISGAPSKNYLENKILQVLNKP